MTSYLFTRQFYQQISSFNIFEHNICNLMSYRRAFFGILKKIQKLEFQWLAEIEFRGVATEKKELFRFFFGSNIFNPGGNFKTRNNL